MSEEMIFLGRWEFRGEVDSLARFGEFPFSVFIKKPKVQVMYIDKDHLHLYVGPNPDMQRDTLLEMTKW